MSAFIVSNDHIDMILTGYRHYAPNYDSPTLEQCTSMGRELLHENCNSVACRYDEPVDECWKEYVFNPIRNEFLDQTALINLCNCLEYQSDVHEGWSDSHARKALDKIRNCFINALPGMKTAPWHYERKAEAA